MRLSPPIALVLAMLVIARALAEAPGDAAYCAEPGGPIDASAPAWNGWGRDLDNTRFQPDPGLTAGDVPRLRVKWAFAFEEGGLFSQPTIVGDRVFVASLPGDAYALDLETGCMHWRYRMAGGARATISVGLLPDGRAAAYVGDVNATVHAVDAVTGERLWTTRVETHPIARITGSPVLHDGRLYVPVSSLEESASTSDEYECCTFRGSVAALDALTGEILWKTYTIPEEPRPFRINRAGTRMWGPAGAAVWSAPTVDPRRGLVYAATGNSYTEVHDHHASNSILALELATGELRWATQVFPDDNYIPGCTRPVPPANCPEDAGPDFDYGASPILRTLPDGRQILISGNKGAFIYGIDPDDGSLLWENRIGRGSALGGIQWGFSADDAYAYIAVSDMLGPEELRRTGMNKVELATGEVVWHTPAPAGACSFGADFPCSNGLSAATTLIPGVVFAGSLDGHIRAFSTDDGAIIWRFDTARLYETVNGHLARGGSLDGPGPSIASGTVLLTSGYGRHTRRQPGNVLLAFTVDGR